MNRTAADTIAAAIQLQAEDIANGDLAVEQIQAGEALIYVTTHSPGTGRRVRAVAMLAVRLVDGALCAGDDHNQVVTMNVRRGFGADKIAVWWARKSYGATLPVEVKHFV
jgi:hypothetical protein